MLTFHPLTVTRRTPIAEDAVCLELAPPPELEPAYRFEAGQHLAIRAFIGGRELRRTYSIASAAGGELRIGVRVQGEVSRYLAESLPVGGTIEALEPTGRFKPAPDAGRARRYAAFAAGSGITPVLSIVATLLAAEPRSRVTLFYGNRDLGRTMFLDDVMALKDRYLDRLVVHCLMSREPQDVELFNGRLDADRVREFARTEFDPAQTDEFFLCGPGTMVKELSAVLRELGATGKIHFERFAVDGAARAPAAPRIASTESGAAAAEVTVIMDGRRRGFPMIAGRTILESAEAAGLTLPYSCRAGVCSTCRTKVVAGSVEMERNQALEDWEVEAGFVLCCQARPTGARTELSYDEK
ncbi:MAG: 2Fe-2S iron-sulfur cluster binding domain-containing protein [Proteobacteria bacterium]|nr:2Fe-2S iron-sulfur cluster binding domain-containing protein [Pseudomonadota bacterium]